MARKFEIHKMQNTNTGEMIEFNPNHFYFILQIIRAFTNPIRSQILQFVKNHESKPTQTDIFIHTRNNNTNVYCAYLLKLDLIQNESSGKWKLHSIGNGYKQFVKHILNSEFLKGKENKIEYLQDVFSIICNNNFIKILMLLEGCGSATVGAIYNTLQMEQSIASRFLPRAHKLGILEYYVDDFDTRKYNYSINEDFFELVEIVDLFYKNHQSKLAIQ